MTTRFLRRLIPSTVSSRALAIAFASCAGLAAPLAAEADKPAAIITKDVPAVPDAVVKATQPYLEARRADFLGWNTADRSMLIKTRFGATNQLHTVRAAGASREQVSFGQEPVLTGSLAPSDDNLTVVMRDTGGDEFYQLYRLEDGQLELVTDGKSRNWIGGWSQDGKWLGYTSSRRNGADMDLYIVDPRDPSTSRMVAEVKGGGWQFVGFTPDGTKGIAVNRLSINEAIIYTVDLETGKKTALTDPKAKTSFVDPKVAADGTVWVVSDAGGSDFLQLGTLDAKTGAFTAKTSEDWDVSDYAIAPDGSFIAYATNEAGVSVMHVMDLPSGDVRKVSQLPQGVIPWAIGPAIQIAPWGEIGFSLSSAKVPGDAFSIDPETLDVTRWTQSETGGLDASQNVEPELVTIKSFDGEPITGFLYRPDPAKFPGKRPLLFDVHGGPEGQSRPGFLGSENYYVNELGMALFFPNVRGSDGFGKRFVNLDNGPWKREDSVKDIGAFFDHFADDAAIDASRISLYGMSYGGYVCYASAVHYSDKLKSASCYVGITNFVTFLENTQDYRRDLRRPEYGNETIPEQRKKLEEISPLNHLDKISIPLFVAVGGNDPRVPASEGEQIVEAMDKSGQPAWYLNATNEGHGFHKKENEEYYFQTSVEFWKQTLLEEGE
ncbi:prolyl oligopeptidase family serine peptidase [Novosphingobium profundi]|uniref:S9 family peptidase n=1 Tax=Novosphingobium profundi TaxID=1774954 RepID=UPI001CFEA437|nr:prolyl oligopeptidase family serine peptidase [Novosphingobium profundi]